MTSSRAASVIPMKGGGRAVLAVAIVASGLKLLIAQHTIGSDDVRYWTEFLGGVAEHGVIGFYGVTGTEAPYNHPPLAGWMLWAFGHAAEAGASFPLLIRTPASVADIGTAMLVYWFVREQRGVSTATLAGVAIALSPVAFIISGYHGNTDPLMVLLAMASLACLVSSPWPAYAAGVLIALSISIKIVAVVMLPALFVVALQRGGRRAVSFGIGGAVVFIVLWLPALVLNGSAFLEQVVGYAGSGPRQWGLTEFGTWLGASRSTLFELGDALRLLPVGIAAILPAYMVMRRPERAPVLGMLPFPLLVLLIPSFSMQYLAWAVAPAYLIAPLLVANTFNAVASVFAVVVYSLWSGGPPWEWFEARSTPFPPAVLPFMLVAWVALLRVCLIHADRPASSRRSADKAAYFV